MRAVIVQEHARFVIMIVGISGNVIAALDDKASFAKLSGDALGQHGSGKTRAYD